MKRIRLFFASIKGQLIIGVVLLQASLMGLFIYDFISREEEFSQQRSLNNLGNLGRLVASNASLSLLNNDLVALGELVSQIEHLPDIEKIYITDANFRVRASNDPAAFNQTFADPRSLAIQEDLRRSPAGSVHTLHDALLDTGAVITVGGKTIGFVRIISTTQSITEQMGRLLEYGIVYILIAIMAMTLIAWLIIRKLTKKLTLLSVAAGEIARGNYAVSLPPFEERDEISRMGRAFRVMIASIHDQVSELESMLEKVQEAEALERQRYTQSEKYQRALFQWAEIGYEDPQTAIRNAVEISAHTLDVERVSVWFLNSDLSALECRDLYTLSSSLHADGFRLGRHDYPHYFEAVVEGRMIAAEDAWNDPLTREFTEGYLKPLGIVSMLDMPIVQGGKVIGVVCHEQIGGKRMWRPEEKEFAIAVTNALALAFEIDKRKQIETTLEYQAHHDGLTDLSNRSLFVDRLEHAIKKAKRRGNKLAVLFIDLDRFKEINDSFGHQMGDMVLVAVADRLRENLREIDTIARLGGDEFTLIIEDIDDQLKVNEIASKLVETLQHPMEIGGHQLYVTVSIGVSLYPLDGEDSQSLLRNADSAMYKAKEEGRNSFQYYSQELTERAFERVAMESSLRRAIANGEFVVYYQPQVDGTTDAIIGMEALVRWNHPQMGLVTPARFIPIAEETGLILAIDEWVMKSAMRQMAGWYAQGLEPGVLSLNLAMKQLWRETCVETIDAMLRESGCRSGWIELEVTEGEIMKNPEKAIAILGGLRDLGVQLAIDDFGTGYSSLSYLKRLPLDILKIDQSFVRGLPEHHEDAAIVRAIIALAQSLGMETIAEGVETKEQKDFLVANGCHLIQGYFYGQPVPAEEMEKMLELSAKKV